MNERNPKFGARCEHGNLARKCDVCYAIRVDAELAEVIAERDATRLNLAVATAALADAETDRDALRAFAQEIYQIPSSTALGSILAFGIQHKLLYFDARGKLVRTPLLTGEQT